MLAPISFSRYEGCADGQRLPPPSGAAVSRSRGDRRRTRPAGRVVGIDHLSRDGATRQGDGGRARRLGIAPGERVAMVSHNSARLLTALFGVSGSGRILVPINFRLVAEEVKYIVAHSGARVLLIDPELEAAMADVECEMKWTIGAESDAILMKFDTEPSPWDGDEDATATINYTSGTTARPKGVQLTHRNVWLNATTFGWHMGVNDRDVYLHTLPQFHCNGWGMLYAVTGMGGQTRDHPQDRRRRDPAARRGARRHADVRCTGRAQHDPRRCQGVGRTDPRQRPGPDRRRRRAAPDGHDRADRDRARLGIRADLRPHRDRSAAHDQPQPSRVGRPVARRASREAESGRRPGDRMHDGGRRDRRAARPVERRDGGVLGAARPDRSGDQGRLLPHG